MFQLNEKVKNLTPYEPISGTYEIRLDANESFLTFPEEIENELTAVPGLLEIVVYEGKSKRGLEHNAIVAEIFPDKEYLEKNGIEDAQAYFKPFISEYNKGAVAYKKITVIKVREEEFPKNTLRKILRFKLDMTID